MFGIGLPELLIILVIALVVLGPDKLPHLARAIGRGLGEFRKATEELKSTLDMDDNLKELKDSLSQAKMEMTQAKMDVSQVMREQTKDLTVDAVAKSLAEGKLFGAEPDKDTAGQVQAPEGDGTQPSLATASDATAIGAGVSADEAVDKPDIEKNGRAGKNDEPAA